MRNLRVVMSDESYSRLLVKARAAGSPGIGAYLPKLAGELTHDAEAHSIARRAEKRALKLDPGSEPFVLKKLFTKDEWEGFSKPARIAAGKDFFAAIDAGLVPGLEKGEKTGSNHQTYLRVDS